MYKRYGDQAEFLAVYVREAHPTDGWRMESNDRVGIAFAQPRGLGERTTLAHQCSARLEINMPLVVDAMDDHVGHAYSGMPDRLYVIDRDGVITYKSGRGPFGFKTGEMEQSLLMTLLEQSSAKRVLTKHGFPILDDADAWKHLPKTLKGGGQALPSWARVLASALPRTTAVMLELDYVQRAKSPLDPALRAKMRWVAAHANRCAVTEAQALADMRRAGAHEGTIRDLAGDWSHLPLAERNALEFARRMSLEADAVTDVQVAQLKKRYGDKQLVAMVLLLAYANFQDRLIQALGVTPNNEDSQAAREIKFNKTSPSIAAPPRRKQAGEKPSTQSAFVNDEEWQSLEFGDLQNQMEGQRARPARIRVPTWDEVRKVLPPGYVVKAPWRIRWSLVCMGYQPELAAGWFDCLHTFAEESRQDRVFEESLFWVITRTLHCFY